VCVWVCLCAAVFVCEFAWVSPCVWGRVWVCEGVCVGFVWV
jgi:hypothetical protein